MTTLQKFCFNL